MSAARNAPGPRLATKASKPKAASYPPANVAGRAVSGDSGGPVAPQTRSKKRKSAPPSRHRWWLDRAQALWLAAESPPTLRLEVALAVKSEANQRGHWVKKATRAAAQREAVARALTAWPAFGDLLRLRQALADGRTVVVGLTLRRPRAYDDDNRTGALKAPRDALAKAFSTDDGSSRLVFLPVAFEKAPGSAVLIEAWVTNASGTEARAGAASEGVSRELVDVGGADAEATRALSGLRSAPTAGAGSARPEVDDE